MNSEGKKRAVTLANDLDATQFLHDEFSQLALIHAPLADTRLMTIPTLLTAFVCNDRLTLTEASDLLEKMSAAMSWEINSYVARAKATLRRERWYYSRV